MNVAGQTMYMRIVVSGGYRFATFRQRGIPLRLTGFPDVSPQVQQVALAQSGCPVQGTVWRKTFSNGAFPIYAVHLPC